MMVGDRQGALMELKQEKFAANMNRIRKELNYQAPQFVLAQTRTLTKKWAWYAPKKTGRLRAGFWPIAIATGMTNIYTSAPNRGEGYATGTNVDNEKATYVFGNRVPYVSFAGGKGGHGTGWWWRGLYEANNQMLELLKFHTGKVLDLKL